MQLLNQQRMLLMVELCPRQLGCQAFGLSNAKVLYRWKAEQLAQSGPVASALEVRVRELETELCRVERERDVLKKALAYGCRKSGGRNE